MSERDIGYGRPPAATRFQKGRSGNPKGRPPGRRNALPYDTVLGQMVTVREEGRTRRISAAEAFLLHVTKTGLQGDGAAARSALAAIEQARASRLVSDPEQVTVIELTMVAPGAVNMATQPLRIAVKLDPYRATARMALEPWIVEAALARLGERRLSLAEQRTVVSATRTPRKVRWPEWWQVMP